MRRYPQQLFYTQRLIKALVPWRLPGENHGVEVRNDDYYEPETTDALEDRLNTSEYFNLTEVTTTPGLLGEEDMPRMTNVGLAAALYLACLATVFGNSLVVIAVVKERGLHSATNYLIASLAVADAVVGLLVMPFSATYEGMNQSWIFGPVVCDLWHSVDVLASTSSILHLCVISLDRYWAITDPFNYPIKMSDKRAAKLIIIVWLCSSSISFPAIAWWRLTADGPAPNWKCPFTDDIGYLVFSSTVSFYGPLAVMVFTYIKIYQAATAYSRSLTSGTKSLGGGGSGEGEITLRIHRGGGAAANKTNGGQMQKGLSTESDNSGKNSKKKATTSVVSRKLARFTKETKAAKTLGTVMGVFIICWLPFFVTNVIAGICPHCISNPELTFAILTWLGWINSSMNPVIYACCSNDFRRAFGKILGLGFAWKSLSNCAGTIKRRTRLENCFDSSRQRNARDFGFNNRPKVVANGCVKNLPNQAIIVTPVSSPSAKSNGYTNLNNGAPVRPTDSSEGGGGKNRINIRQNITARYAVNYRSLESSNSSLTTVTPVNNSSHNSSWDESQSSSVTMQGGRGKSFFPVRAKTMGGMAGESSNNLNSFYTIPPPNFSFRPGVSTEKLL